MQVTIDLKPEIFSDLNMYSLILGKSTEELIVSLLEQGVNSIKELAASQVQVMEVLVEGKRHALALVDNVGYKAVYIDRKFAEEEGSEVEEIGILKPSALSSRWLAVPKGKTLPLDFPSKTRAIQFLAEEWYKRSH